jgi:hypothetical protein
MRALPLLLLLAPAAWAQERVDRRWAVDPDCSIRISSTVGVIRVSGWDRDTLAVTADIPKGAGGFYGGGKGKLAKLGVERSEYSRSPGATLVIRLPRQARVWIKTVSAEVEVTGLDGEVDVSAVSGSAHVSGSPRVLTVETLEGSVTAALGRGVARLRTGAGPIRVQAAGGDVTAISVDGRVELESPRLARGRLESVGGAVRFTGNLEPGAGLEIETHSGDIELRFNGPVNAEFDLTAVAGAVRGDLVGKQAARKGKSVRFTVGDGGATVTARSFKATILVTR